MESRCIFIQSIIRPLIGKEWIRLPELGLAAMFSDLVAVDAFFGKVGSVATRLLAFERLRGRIRGSSPRLRHYWKEQLELKHSFHSQPGLCKKKL
jgi:hypothetical protein